ncbi:MAG: cell division protein FtsB [Gammaproteobacteria bacterium]|nr:cell division protein FtsB [Gammaproteobacteria bacterium]
MYHLLLSVLVVGTVALQGRLWLGDGGIRDVWRLEAAIAMQEAENAQLRRRNAELAAEVEDLKEGNAAIEERARYDLGMIRKGEEFYLIVER